MNKETIKEILYIVIAVALGVLAFKFIRWLLPIIIIGFFSLLIYSSMKSGKEVNKNKNIKEIYDYKEKENDKDE